MRASAKVSLVAGACAVFSLAASAFLLRRADALRPRAAVEDVLYVSSPKVLKRASLGYSGLLADIYWTRAVQYFGDRHRKQATTYNLLFPLLQITAQLDPQLVAVYEFGASFLAPSPPFGAGLPEQAVDLMKFGIENNPNDWKLYYDLGFVYYVNIKDYNKAAETFARGSQAPNAHPFMRVLAAQMAQHAGEFDTSRMLWTDSYQNTTDKQIRQNALEHLRALRVDEDVTRLQQAVTEFRERTGRLPASMSELLSAGGFAQAPRDPDGHAYELDSAGHVLVHSPDDFPFATVGLPPGYTPQPKFHTSGN
jgi:tetratricopeptide (TPR) repeat protein